VENAAVLCENHHERVTQYLTSLSVEEEKKERKTFWPFGDFLFLVPLRYFFAPLGMLMVMKALKDEWYVVRKVYKFTTSEILRDFGIIIYCMSVLSQHIESTNSDILH